MLAALVLSTTQVATFLQRSAVEITPAEPVPLGGYTARGSKLSEPGGDPLFARTTIVTHGKTKIAVVSAELLTVPESLHREVQSRIPKDIHLFLIATHTHCAPDSQMLNDRMTFSIPGIASFRSRWLSWYADQIAGGVRKALEQPLTSVAAWGVDTALLPLNRGRRTGALPDSQATIVRVLPSGKTGQNVWFHFAAHAIFWGSERMQTSGDWPWVVNVRTGADVLVGAIGDVSPASPGETPQARIRSFVDTVVRGFTRDEQSWRMAELCDVGWSQSPVTMGDQKPHPEFAKTNRIPEPLAQSLVDKFAPKEAKITAFRIGKVAFVGVPGEPTSHLGRRIRDFGRNLGFEHVLVCSHVNGWMGYILDARDYARGGYEATLSMHGPDQGDNVVAAACESLRNLAKAR